VTPILIPNLTDAQLTELGVTTVGDKAMLRAAGFCHPQYVDCKFAYTIVAYIHKQETLYKFYWYLCIFM